MIARRWWRFTFAWSTGSIQVDLDGSTPDEALHAGPGTRAWGWQSYHVIDVREVRP